MRKKAPEPIIEVKGKSVPEPQDISVFINGKPVSAPLKKTAAAKTEKKEKEPEPVQPTPPKAEPEAAKAEKTDQPKPAKKKFEPEPKLRGYFNQFKGERLVIQLRNGIVIEGTIEHEEFNFVKIVDAVILGRNWRSTVAWTIMDRQQVSHFHPIPLTIEKDDTN